MMTGDGIAPTGVIRRWSPHDIGKRTVGLNEIEVSSCYVFELIVEITHQGNAFQKHLGQSYG